MGLQRDEPSPWRALTQLEYLGCTRRDGSSHRTYPDLFVFRHAIDPLRGSFTLETDGPPALIIEILSESTYRSDINLERGKGYSYEHAGAPEYLVLDPTYTMMEDGIHGWRLAGKTYHPWEPGAVGRLYSQQLPIAIALEGAAARIYLSDGRSMPREDEVGYALEEKDKELQRLRRLLAERE